MSLASQHSTFRMRTVNEVKTEIILRIIEAKLAFQWDDDYYDYLYHQISFDFQTISEF